MKLETTKPVADQVLRGLLDTNQESMELGVLLAELKVCSSLKDIEKGKQCHVQAIASGNYSCPYVATALVRMYAKCRCMVDAHRVFDSIECPNVVAWTVLISGYVDKGEGRTALSLFRRMRRQGCEPNSITFLAALKACTSLALSQDERGRAECRELGREIHSEIGCHSSIYIQNTLIDMYANCGCMGEARRVFDSIEHPNVVSWNVLILGYAENGEGSTALDLFSRMRFQGFGSNSGTFVAALKSVTALALSQDGKQREECLQLGKQLHSKVGCRENIFVQNTLIDMYAKCGSMRDARQVFDNMKSSNVVSWNALILGYAENGQSVTALNMFSRMKSQGYAPNSFNIVAAIKACTYLGMEQSEHNSEECFERGKQIHLEAEPHMDHFVQSSLIDMYAKLGRMGDAREVFNSIKHPNVVSWTALIWGYAENGEGATSLDLFASMRLRGCTPNNRTFLAALKASGSLGALDSGSKIHAEMDIATGDSAILITSLVDFYAKCGCLAEAQELFDKQPTTRDLTTWNALLAGYSRLGYSKAAFELLEKMQDAGLRPDGVTFLNILTCCNHAGLLDKAKDYFVLMSERYGVLRSVEHYNCMVDILGRWNILREAIELLRSMPLRPDAVTWTTLLGACRKWKSFALGRLAFTSVVSLDKGNAAAYVLMAHIYGSRGMWQEQELVLRMRNQLIRK